MKFLLQLCLLALFVLANCTPFTDQNIYSPLDVTLTSVGNTILQAVIQNVGSSDVTLVTAGSLFDKRPVKKINMYSGSTALPFRGTTVDPKPINQLVAADYTTIHGGQSFSVKFDAAAMYDLSSGGIYTAEAAGSLWDAERSSFMSYKSDLIKITVDGNDADISKLSRRQGDRPAKTQGCTDSQSALLARALGACYLYADAGAHATWNKSADHFFDQYFASDDGDDHREVHDRLIAVARECESYFDSAVNITCTDQYGKCQDHVVAYRAWYPNAEASITLCKLAFRLSETDTSCQSLDMASLLVAQHTYFESVYKPATDERLDAEYDPEKKIVTSDALLTSESYRLFSKAAYIDCN